MKKVLSLLLAAVLLCGLCGVSALAEGEADIFGSYTLIDMLDSSSDEDMTEAIQAMAALGMSATLTVNEDGSALIHLLIGADNRESGYGSSGLKHIASVALENGMDTLSVRMHRSSPYFKYMKRRGFKPAAQDGEFIVMKADSHEVSSGRLYEIDETCCRCRKKENSDAGEDS